MRSLSSELIYVLIFVGIFVVQYLMKRRAGRRAPESTRHARLAPAAETMPPQSVESRHVNPVTWAPPRAPVELIGRSDAPAAARPPPRRRFTRQALLGTQRDVQNAIVLASIIGPCRALEPPGEPCRSGMRSTSVSMMPAD